VKRAFLDANVLFSAAWREDSGLARLWRLPGCELLTSRYAAEEARRNLSQADQRQRLAALMAGVRLVADDLHGQLPPGIDLPEKDRPILCAAMRAGATHLLTGDRQHFGVLYGQTAGGVTILRPSEFLALPEQPAPERSVSQ
jgi:predicted nucleic acid-binding protein